ncbi:MAG: nickel pincer cofactor biosynthesis protein LarB [Chloroflexi bacterium]|nr:nickel pincer cofactor biosynthesis protein LarB [Chloroflexota bacterium]MCI0829644.1 nickel pincer cofactor biosynthesis protein LarB [Chloroflexota bacterium]MCI0897354.1 nickel pincer cofactor biosynthesis protein LarB [Chloroflexota bacterium]
MQEERLRELLVRFKENGESVDAAIEQLRDLPYQDIGFAKLDHHRALRTGWPEVIFGKGKTPEQVAMIVSAMKGRGHPVLVTKSDQETYQAVLQDTPEAEFHQLPKAIVVPEPQATPLKEGITVVTAGTADLPVAEEAALTASLMGNDVTMVSDVGVAGLHRLLDQLPELRKARVLVVVAGMDAALVGVVAGLVSVPVIAVPTSTGYGASFDGLAPLLSMLNSCAPGVAVVNIDNGFGAGHMAALTNCVGADTSGGEQGSDR